MIVCSGNKHWVVLGGGAGVEGKPLSVFSTASLWVPKMSSGCPEQGLWRNGPRARNCAMALSFLYLAFVRILQLLHLSRQDSDELAVEVVMLRHEVAVLRRQVVRPRSVRKRDCVRH
jgi:hypothetical protein